MVYEKREYQGTHLIPHKSLYERMLCDILEMGLGLKVAMVERLDGTVEGIRLPVFEYTEQNIIAHRDHIHGLSNGGGWLDDRKRGRLFEENIDLESLQGLGKKMKQKLNDLGILNLHYLFDALSDETTRDNIIRSWFLLR